MRGGSGAPPAAAARGVAVAVPRGGMRRGVTTTVRAQAAAAAAAAGGGFGGSVSLGARTAVARRSKRLTRSGPGVSHRATFVGPRAATSPHRMTPGRAWQWQTLVAAS